MLFWYSSNFKVTENLNLDFQNTCMHTYKKFSDKQHVTNSVPQTVNKITQLMSIVEELQVRLQPAYFNADHSSSYICSLLHPHPTLRFSMCHLFRIQ